MNTINRECALNIRLLVDIKNQTIQPGIKSVSDRRDSLGNGSGDTSQIVEVLLDCLGELNTSVDAILLGLADNIELVRIATNASGCSKISLLSFLAYVPYPESYTTVSALWSYCGLRADFDSYESERYNPKAKSALYSMMREVLAKNNAYREVYRESMEKYKKRGWDTGHCDLASLRVTAKVWLSHLHEVARMLAGEESTLKRAVERSDNIHYKEDFGWQIG